MTKQSTAKESNKIIKMQESPSKIMQQNSKAVRRLQSNRNVRHHTNQTG